MKTNKLSKTEGYLAIEQATKEIEKGWPYLSGAFSKFISHFYSNESDREKIVSMDYILDHFFEIYMGEYDSKEDAAFSTVEASYPWFITECLDIEKLAECLFNDYSPIYIYVNGALFARYEKDKKKVSRNNNNKQL